MSSEHYNHGSVHGQAPYGLTPGSPAHVDAMRGVKEYEERQRHLEQVRQSHATQTSHTAAHHTEPNPLAIAVLVIGAGVAIAIIKLVVGIFDATMAVGVWLGQWRELGTPDMFVAFWYHYVLAMPIKGFGAIWSAIVGHGLTGWAAVNVPVAVLAEFVYIILLTAAWMIAKSWLQKVKITHAKTVVFILPGVVLGVSHAVKAVW